MVSESNRPCCPLSFTSNVLRCSARRRNFNSFWVEPNMVWRGGMRVYVTASLAPPITRVLGARQRLPGVFFAFGNDQ